MTASRVLVVDDNRDMAEGIAMLLAETGLDAAVAHSAPDALSLLEPREFELVLTDIRMPGMTGLELLKRIRERWPLTKVVMLTAYGSTDSVVDAMRSGACDYVTKPFDNDALLSVVARALASGATAGGLDISSVVGEVAATVSPEDLLPSLKRALAVLVRATGADAAELFLCAPESREPLLAAWAGPDGDTLLERVRFEVGAGYPGLVVATGEPLVARGSLASDPRFLRRAVTDAGMRSLVAAPLLDADRPMGSLQLFSRRADFPVESALALLRGAGAPMSNALRAGLAALRESVDRLCDKLGDGAAEPLRAVLDAMRQAAGAKQGTLTLVDGATGAAGLVVSTGPAPLNCRQAEAGAAGGCPSASAAQGLAADPGRRAWPEPCRRGLARRATSPACLPLVAGERVLGTVILDFGREGTEHATGHLVPLLTMAQQLALRLQAHAASHAPDARPDSAAPSATLVVAPPTADLALHCLGPFLVLRRGQAIPAEAFTRSKALVLLKLLALKAGAPVHRDVLMEHLWPEVSPKRGANRLHGVVHDLRSVIEPRWAEREWTYVRNRGELYYLDVQAPVDVDVGRFRLLASQGLQLGREPALASIPLLQAATDLYRGDLFEDEPFADWCQTERDELKETQLKALQRLSELHCKAGEPESALACLARAARAAPFRDDLVVTRLELLLRLGRAAEALAAFDDTQRLWAGQLETEPSPELLAVQRRILTALHGPASTRTVTR